MGCDDRFAVESSSRLEPILVDRVCEPVLKRIPESIRPNTISLVTHILAWASAILAGVAHRLSAPGLLLALAGAGLCLFASMVGDCLDGMQARRTNRCSKLGEMMDHWLDAINVPLVNAGMVLALQMRPLAAAAVHVTGGAMIYNAQLVLYHRTGRFVHPGTSGVDGQFGSSIGYLVLGVFFFFFPRQLAWVEVVVTAIATLAIVVQLNFNRFYYLRLRRLVVYHLPFVAICSAYAALLLVGAVAMIPFLLLVVFVSFRITGSFVLCSIVERPYAGFDWAATVCAAMIAAAHFWLAPLALGVGVSLQQLLPYGAMALLAALNVADLLRWFGALRPASARD